jgi:protein-S-isoprenylcysteine O-methyltransferase Ste14
VPDSFLRLRVPLGFLFAAWYLVIARPVSCSLFFLCTLLVLTGCLLRSWAAGYLFKGKRVAVGGPYAYIRNPLYVGSFILGSGFCVVLWQKPLPVSSMLIAASFLLGFGFVYRGKTLAEEQELVANLGEPYKTYASHVPPFLPSKGHVDGLGDQRFSWELYRRNREYECWMGSLAILFYLYVRFRHAI